MFAKLNGLVELEAEQSIGNFDMPPIPNLSEANSFSFDVYAQHISVKAILSLPRFQYVLFMKINRSANLFLSSF